MKRVSKIIMIASIMIIVSSCYENTESVVYIDGIKATHDVVLEERDGLFYLINEDEPYTGIQTAYYEDGTKVMESEIIDGLPRFGTHYYLDGSVKLKTENKYHEDSLSKWLTFYPNGMLKSSYDWLEDPVTGLKEHKEWYSNGQIKFEAPIVGTSYHGILKYYDESGTLVSETLYENGKPVDG